MTINPVLHREFLLRMRWRSDRPLVITVAILVLLLVVFVYYLLIQWAVYSPGASTGSSIWMTCTIIQFIIISFFGPISAANAITREKEQQTWDTLVLTPLKPIEIVFGKLLARLLPIAAFVLLFTPGAIYGMLLSLGDVNGGRVTLLKFTLSSAVILVCLLFFTCSSLFISSKMKRSIYSVMLNYVWVIGFLMMGTALISGAIASVVSTPGFMEKSPLLWINPVYLITVAVSWDATGWASFSGEGAVGLFWGLITYVLISLFMIWRLTANFNNFAYDND